MDDVARYYDANTGRFLLAGPRGGVHSIHRELWGPGVETAAESVDYVNGLLAEEIRGLCSEGDEQSLSIVDFGCGVGGTMLRLAEGFPRGRFVGVTISPRQVEIGRRLTQRALLADRCSFVLGDLRRTDVGRGHDVAIAVESFVHLEHAVDFFEAAARALRPGASLLIVDDFLSRPLVELSRHERRRVDDFRRGWRVSGLSTVEAVRAAGEEAGFEADRFDDLTDLVKTGRPRDRLIATLSPMLRAFRLARIPFFGNMVGGDALQKGLRAGTLRYGMLVFRRTA